MIMEKSEKLILEAFCKTTMPEDFDRMDMGMFVADITGFVKKLLSKGYLDSNDLGEFKLDKETKYEIAKFVTKSKNNLIYYNLIKLCFILFDKYKN